MSEIVCHVCHRGCHLKEGQIGFCRARKNENGRNVCANYGRITSMAMDPIEKKPLRQFYPGSSILSVGSYGCNFACPFCQNYSISMSDADSVPWISVSPQELAVRARSIPGNLGAAFTYNEPLISYEYIIATARLLRPEYKIVLVSNGCVSKDVLDQLLPYIDAINIDLKGDEAFYRELGGSYALVKQTIAACVPRIHTEVTILVIPGKNDNPAWIDAESTWLSQLSEDVVLHLSRYFPRYHYAIEATPRETILWLQQVAQKHLRYVYTGNMGCVLI